MASTYSNLKIQLMATGENTTTWGDVTNLNLGTAIEEAIVGSADVTFASANVTLSLTNTNSTQTARNMRLRLTGTTGGSTRNLVVPSIEKPYIIKNDCADSVLVKTSAGTGITVPAGKTMWVYVDGTNVVDAVTHLSSLTLDTPLAVAQGGTGSNTASGARTALGLGSLATASSVNLTNQVTDVLGIPNGGTGGNTASDARTALGLGSMATQNSDNVTVTGGNVGGVTINSSIIADSKTLTPTELGYLDGVTSAIQTQINSLSAASIPSGTKMLFAQTAAPTGWTKDTTHDNKALRVVSGTASSGGSVAFTTAFTSQAVAGTVGDTALTLAQIPPHTHSVTSFTTDTVDDGGSAPSIAKFSGTTTTGSAGSGATHTHTFTGTAINLAVQYVDVIIATKN